MKLSMWMIANRLSELDMELNIREEAPVILKSARLAYASDCVHIYQEGDDLICNGEGDIIRIHNMDVRAGLELIQSVFDYFQDWMDNLIFAVRKRNYQEVIDLAWQVFQNPIILLEGNNRVLAMTRQYPPDSLDAEWAYLSQYGYSSLNAVQQMRYNRVDMQFMRHGPMHFDFSTPFLSYGGISYCMCCNDIICGRINVLDKDRSLNRGDQQMLEIIASLLEPVLGQIYYENVFSSTNVFFNILFGHPYDKKALQIQMEYQNWRPEDIFQLTIIEVLDESGNKAQQGNVDLLMQTIIHQSLSCIVMKKGMHILLLSNYDLSRDVSMLRFFDTLRAGNTIRVAHSLPCQGLDQAGFLYEQACYAMMRGREEGAANVYYSFQNYAVDFIIESDSLEKSAAACMPELSTLWNMQEKNGDELLHTLKIYLENERSLTKTAEVLFTHRNTAQYRIRKITDYLGCDLNDAYIRSYCLISIRILELLKSRKLRLRKDNLN